MGSPQQPAERVAQLGVVAWRVQNLTKGSPMSVPRWLMSLPLLCLALACGGGSGNNGGGGNNPSLSISPASSTVIAGGSPVNFTAALANTTGTVSWALTGPGSIDPASGDTTSYTPPGSVASATTATLTATSGTLTASATITVNPPPTITVAGTVVNTIGSGVSGATVAIGSQHATTDASGAFSLPGVTAPYDAMVIVPFGSRNAVIVFKGLTRTDPKLFAILISGTPPHNGTVSGSGERWRPVARRDRQHRGGLGLAGGHRQLVLRQQSLDHELPVGAGPAATTGNVHALQWTPTTGIPTSYKGYGVTTGVAVANGGSTTAVAVAMSVPLQHRWGNGDRARRGDAGKQDSRRRLRRRSLVRRSARNQCGDLVQLSGPDRHRARPPRSAPAPPPRGPAAPPGSAGIAPGSTGTAVDPARPGGPVDPRRQCDRGVDQHRLHLDPAHRRSPHRAHQQRRQRHGARLRA